MPSDRIYRLRSGDVLASLRKSAGLTQRAIAEPLGISRGAVAQWETGRSHGIAREYAPVVAEMLHVPMHVLFDVPIATETPHARTRRSVRRVAAPDRQPAAAASRRR